jgi:hypothetical protein
MQALLTTPAAQYQEFYDAFGYHRMVIQDTSTRGKKFKTRLNREYTFFYHM